MKKVLILDIYRDSNYRISKDTNGGYGTENDFGTGIIPSVLSRVTKKSLFWPPLSALNLLSEFLRDNNFIVKFSHEINSVDHDVDYIFLTTSIVCSKTELNCAQRLRIAFPKIRIYAIGPFAKILQTEYNKIGVTIIDGEPEFLFQNIKINSANLNLINAENIFSIIKKNPNQLADPLWVKSTNSLTRNYLFGYQNGYIPIIASRGCPYSCFEYCVYPLTQGRLVNSTDPEKILNDINFINKHTGSSNFVFRDPVFSINKKYTNELLIALQNNRRSKKGKSYSFTIETHLNNINDDLASNFYAAGINWVKFGIESADMSVKENVNRYSLENDEQIKKVKICKKYNLKTVAMYILCQPDDTLITHNKTIDYSKALKTNLAQFSLFTPYPGTPYFLKNKDSLITNDFEKYNQYNLIYKHNIFNANSAKKELGRAYSSYYINKLFHV